MSDNSPKESKDEVSELTLEEKYKKLNQVSFNLLKKLVDSSFAVYTRSLYKDTTLFHELCNPKIGDVVFESTSYVFRKGNPSLNSIGILKEQNKDKGEYLIEDFTGESVSWKNAKFIKVLTEFSDR